MKQFEMRNVRYILAIRHSFSMTSGSNISSLLSSCILFLYQFTISLGKTSKIIYAIGDIHADKYAAVETFEMAKLCDNNETWIAENVVVVQQVI